MTILHRSNKHHQATLHSKAPHRKDNKTLTTRSRLRLRNNNHRRTRTRKLRLKQAMVTHRNSLATHLPCRQQRRLVLRQRKDIFRIDLQDRGRVRRPSVVMRGSTGRIGRGIC
jgi:hypothetical protein